MGLAARKRRVSNPNVKPPPVPYVAPAPPPPKAKYVPPKELPVVTAIGVAPGPEGKANTYTLLLYRIKGDKVLKCSILEACYFGLTDVVDSISNWAFDIFFLKAEVESPDNEVPLK
jgi:hypothetical protein